MSSPANQPHAPRRIGSGAAATPASPAAGLRDALDAIYRKNLSREELGREAAELIAHTHNLRAVVIVGCDPKRTRLHIVGNVGVEPKGLDALIGPSGRWMVLRCLNEHRINVTSSAQDNPFVPKLIASMSPKSLTIGSIPLFLDSVPAGAAVLFATTANALTDAVLSGINHALRGCVPAFAEPPPAGNSTTPASIPVTRPVSPPAEPRIPSVRSIPVLGDKPARVTPDSADLAHTQRLLTEERQRVTMLEKELARMRDEMTRSSSHQIEVQRLNRRALDTQAAAAQARTQAAVLREALADAERRARDDAAMLDGLTVDRNDDGMEAIPVTVDPPTVDLLFRLTDSITGLLNQALGVDQHQDRIIEDVRKEIASLHGPAVPVSDGGRDEASLAAPARGLTEMPETAMAMQTHTKRELTQTLDDLGQEGLALVDLRDWLQAWRIRRTEHDDSATADPADFPAQWDPKLGIHVT